LLRIQQNSKLSTVSLILFFLATSACSPNSTSQQADVAIAIVVEDAGFSSDQGAQFSTFRAHDAGRFFVISTTTQIIDAGLGADRAPINEDATIFDALSPDLGTAPEDAGLDGGLANSDSGSFTSTCASGAPAGALFASADACLENGAAHGTQPGYFTTGQAWGDFDNDGWPDLYIPSQAGPTLLCHNQGDGSFVRSTHSSTLALTTRVSGGAVFADYDNDGDQDLYVLNHGANTLFRNDNGLGFTDVTATASVGDPGRGMTASWGDYDNDGLLDLYVANGFCNTCSTPPGVEGSRDRLYHNEGNGRFTDVTSLLGEQFTLGQAFAAVFLDYDNDGDLDIYLANDRGRPGPFTPGSYMNRNVLWQNEGPGCGGWCFNEVAETTGADARVDAMGLAVGDYDEDGDLDIYCTHAGFPVLLQNDGAGQFNEVGRAANAVSDSQSWGTFFFDYDNDADLDLYVAIGWDPWGVDGNELYQNMGNGSFREILSQHQPSHLGISFGAAYADYDKDGHLDFVVGNWGTGYKLYRNTGNNSFSNRWIRYRLIGNGRVNRDAIGTRVFITLDNGKNLMQEVKSGSSLGAGNDLALHFGIGQAQITDVAVRWTDGVYETLPLPTLDQEIIHHHP